MTAAATGNLPPLTAATVLHGLRPSVAPEPRTRRERRATERTASDRRRMGPAIPLFLAGTLAFSTTITGVVTPVDTRTKNPKPKPVVSDRGTTVREAFVEAKRAAAAAATAIRTTLAPPALYTVGEHETLPDIATRYGLSTASLLALNGLSWSSAVHAGQILKLTASGPIAPAAREAAEPPVPQEQRHTVASGESLSSVASVYGVDTEALLSANGFSPSSIIYPGQIVTIPPPPAVVVAVVVEEEPAPAPQYADYSGYGSIGLTESMAQYASIIIQVGRSMGVPDYGIVIALATAAQESTLRNLDWGDRDSVGLFQQRPSQGWGTVEQLTDPWESTRRFFGGPGVPTRGLLDISGWQSMPLTVAAQAVQISAYPDAYAKWESSARTWLTELS